MENAFAVPSGLHSLPDAETLVVVEATQVFRYVTWPGVFSGKKEGVHGGAVATTRESEV